MADLTGSTLIGLFPSLRHTLPSGTFADIGLVFGYVFNPPNNSMTCLTGSDVVYCVGDANFYIGDIVNGAGGSVWKAMTAP